jgi:methionine-rich copper-binding protein CopC
MWNVVHPLVRIDLRRISIMRRRIGLLVGIGLLLSLALVSVVSAHAKLVSSDPATGAKLTAAPAKITLTFSEEISAKATDSFFNVTDAQGNQVGSGTLDNTDLDHKTLSGTLNSGAGDGVYTVTWQTITTDDNGQSSGSFSFGVNKDPGAQPTAAPEPTEAPEPTPAAGSAAQPTAAAPTTPGGTPSDLPKTGDGGADLSISLVLGVAILLAGGLVLHRARRRT